MTGRELALAATVLIKRMDQAERRELSALLLESGDDDQKIAAFLRETIHRQMKRQSILRRCDDIVDRFKHAVGAGK